MKVMNKNNPGKKRVIRGVVFVWTVCVFFFCLNQAVHADVVFQEDFQGDWGSDWHADHGTWDAGVPTSGPESAYGGSHGGLRLQ